MMHGQRNIKFKSPINVHKQGSTNPMREVAQASKLCAVTPHIFGAPYGTRLMLPIILRWLLHYKKCTNLCSSIQRANPQRLMLLPGPTEQKAAAFCTPK